MLLDTRPKEDKKQRQSLFCPFVPSHFSLYQLTTRTFHPLWTRSSDVISRKKWKEVTWHGWKGFLYSTSAVKFRISLLWLRCVMMHLPNLNLSTQLQGAAKFVTSFCYFLRLQGLETAWEPQTGALQGDLPISAPISLYKHFPISCLVSSKQS